MRVGLCGHVREFVCMRMVEWVGECVCMGVGGWLLIVIIT